MSNNYRFAKRENNGNAGHTGSKPSASKGTASPVTGVDRLDYGHDNNFVIIRQQLADKLREDHGDLSSFIMSGVRHERVVPTMASIDVRYPELTAIQRASIYPSLILAHEKQTKGRHRQVCQDVRHAMSHPQRRAPRQGDESPQLRPSK
jgi:hypothetical protein